MIPSLGFLPFTVCFLSKGLSALYRLLFIQRAFCPLLINTNRYELLIQNDRIGNTGILRLEVQQKNNLFNGEIFKKLRLFPEVLENPMGLTSPLTYGPRDPPEELHLLLELCKSLLH